MAHAVSKKSLRSMVKHRLRNLSMQDIAIQSTACVEQLLHMPSYQNSKTLSIYLSMPFELQTQQLIHSALKSGKRVFIPKVLGKESSQMTMVPIESFEEIEAFPKNAWGIPEPIVESATSDEALISIDLIIVPGVAFSMNFDRLGHGKGYYDCFINQLTMLRRRHRLPPPKLISLALQEQIVEHVPTENHDCHIDALVVPTGVYHNKSNPLM